MDPVAEIKVDPLITAARRLAAQLSLQYQDPRLLLHNDQLAAYLEERVQSFGTGENATEEELRIGRLATIFYPLGIQINAANPAQATRGIVERFLQQQQADRLLEPLYATLQQVYQKG